jgi:hypothetical protein
VHIGFFLIHDRGLIGQNDTEVRGSGRGKAERG